MRHSLLSILLAATLFSACRARQDVEPVLPPYLPHYSFGLKYLLVVEKVTALPEEPLIVVQSDQSAVERCVTLSDATLCLGPRDRSVIMNVVNRGGTELAIDWSRAAFVYPSGQTRAVEGRTPLAPYPNDLNFETRGLRVPANWASSHEIWPAGKVYYAGDQDNAYIMHEPLIPLTLSGSPEKDIQVVEHFAAAQDSLRLRVPVERRGGHSVLDFQMILVNRIETETRWAETRDLLIDREDGR